MSTQGLAAHVDAIVASWPKLSDEQLDRIAALLRSDQPMAKRGNRGHTGERHKQIGGAA
jgi:hypothetical protein